MWQRIQTVFLILIIACMAVSFFLPIWKVANETSQMQLYPLYFSITEGGSTTLHYFPYSIVAILLVTAATIAGIQIKRYDNRLTQIKLGTFNSLILAGALGAAAYFYSKVSSEYGHGKIGFPTWIIFGGVASNWLALRFIRRDEKLVRDSERLR